MIAQLVVGKDQPWLAGYAIALFASSAALLLNTLQFSATAISYAATPSERLDYNPEAASDSEIMRVIRSRQWEEMDLRTRYLKRARISCSAGLLAFLAGLGAIIVPHHSWPWPPVRLIGVVVIGCALLLEILWMLPGQPLGWLLPRISTATAPDMPQEGADYLFGDASSDEILMNLRRCVELLEQITDRRPAP